jgi:hypothetical protein
LVLLLPRTPYQPNLARLLNIRVKGRLVARLDTTNMEANDMVARSTSTSKSRRKVKRIKAKRKRVKR